MQKNVASFLLNFEKMFL